MSTRSGARSRMVVERLTAAGDTLFRWRSYMPLVLLPLFVLSVLPSREPTPFAWEAACFAVSMLGLVVRSWVIGTAPSGTSARGTRTPTADSLSISGAYSVVRHPLYLANTVIALGCALLSGTWYLPLIVLLLSFVYHERIAAREEAFLLEKFGDAFRAWTNEVPATVPRLSGFRAPAGSFQLGKVLVQESQGLFAIGTAFLVLDTIDDSLATRSFQVDRRWLLVFVLTGLPFVATLVWKQTAAIRQKPS